MSGNISRFEAMSHPRSHKYYMIIVTGLRLWNSLRLSAWCKLSSSYGHPGNRMPLFTFAKGVGKHCIQLTHCVLVTAIWPHRSGSTLAKVMAWCLMAPSHYLNQCWLLICGVIWQLPERNEIASAQATNQYNELENYTFEINTTYIGGQCVNSALDWHLTLHLSIYYLNCLFSLFFCVCYRVHGIHQNSTLLVHMLSWSQSAKRIL